MKGKNVVRSLMLNSSREESCVNRELTDQTACLTLRILAKAKVLTARLKRHGTNTLNLKLHRYEILTQAGSDCLRH